MLYEPEMIEIPAGGGCEKFMIGKFPVTVREWNAVMESDKRKGDDWNPVTGVNIEDIGKYIKGLNNLSGMKYRLPTEAEWCWAVGKEPEVLEDYAVFGQSNCPNVGTKLPNEYGLYDMRGLVWEWMTTGRKGKRYALRGGSWFLSQRYARAAYRNGLHPAVRYFALGFRLVLCLRP